MTREEIVEGLKLLEDNMVHFDELQNDKSEWIDVHELLFETIQALSQEPCDAIRREAALTIAGMHTLTVDETIKAIKNLPSVTQKSGKCKNCKYFEYDSVAKIDGVPLIVAHEICNKWGDGCKTSEDGYCYLFEPQERSDKE